LGRLFRAKKLSPVEVTDAVLARIERLNPKLNAYLTVTADHARELARAAEARAMRGGLQTPLDGIPYWDTGAPGLAHLSDYLARPAEPFNDYEPVDSSAAAIAAQGLLRLGNYLRRTGAAAAGERYRAAAFSVTATLLDEPYLSVDERHQGLLLHSVYHRPNGWDYVPPGRNVPCGESSMWGDYHARELALLIQREATDGPYPTFFDPDCRQMVSDDR
jgi:hypothetical protein